MVDFRESAQWDVQIIFRFTLSNMQNNEIGLVYGRFPNKKLAQPPYGYSRVTRIDITFTGCANYKGARYNAFFILQNSMDRCC